MKEQVRISRASNGWLVTINHGYTEKVVVCTEWTQVLHLATERTHETPVGGTPDLTKPVNY